MQQNASTYWPALFVSFLQSSACLLACLLASGVRELSWCVVSSRQPVCDHSCWLLLWDCEICAILQGILIKGGQYLEALARLKAITFDKTGTLTEGRFGVIAVEAFEGHSKEDVLQWSAAVELHSTHPVGPTIVGCAAARGVAVRYVPFDGFGVQSHRVERL